MLVDALVHVCKTLGIVPGGDVKLVSFHLSPMSYNSCVVCEVFTPTINYNFKSLNKIIKVAQPTRAWEGGEFWTFRYDFGNGVLLQAVLNDHMRHTTWDMILSELSFLPHAQLMWLMCDWVSWRS